MAKARAFKHHPHFIDLPVLLNGERRDNGASLRVQLDKTACCKPCKSFPYRSLAHAITTNEVCHAKVLPGGEGS